MMKLTLLACLVTYALADVSHIVGQDERKAAILKQELDVAPAGAYEWSYETANGISARAKGDLINPDAENAAQKVQGEAQWTSPEGELISLQYIADENGYQPQGSHLPTPPPIPEAIIRALQYIRDHPPAPEKN